MSFEVTLIQGGGAGLDQVPAVKDVLAAAGVDVTWHEFPAGWAALEKGLPALPGPLLDSVRRTGVALKTKLLPPPGEEGVARNFNVALRRELGLFATVRPLKNLPGLPARFQGVDMLVIREITEDLYTSIEHEVVPGVVQSIKVVTRAASERFFRFAFDYARAAGRKSIACVHKANILKLADGLFLEAFRQTARAYPEFQTRELIVDNCCMQMVSRPQQFDVLVMGNLYGDLVSDLAAGVVGGGSATHGINVGPAPDAGGSGHHRAVPPDLPPPEVGGALHPRSPASGLLVFECFHGGGRDAIPEGRANPLPLLLPAADMLQFHNHQAAAARILDAVGKVLTSRAALTPDLGGQATTAEMAEAIIAALGSG